MHRALGMLFSFDAPYATAFCVALATVASNVALPEPLQLPAAVDQAIASTPTPSQETPSEDKADARPDYHAAEGSADVIVVQPDTSSGSDVPWSPIPNDPAQSDRNYLIETASPGNTMMRQGPEVAIGRLHPEFVHRLAGAIREARESGLASAGIFSAYRPPAFGVGGFSDKFNSLHTYGLAVDMSGIGGPGSADAKLWYEIASRHGVVCPYGFENRVEWNHCQPTRIKIILPASPLRETVTADGPVDLQSMFRAGNSLIEDPAEANQFLALETTEHGASAHIDIGGKDMGGKDIGGKRSDERMPRVESRNALWNPGLIKEDVPLRTERRRLARAETPSACAHPHRGRKGACGTSHLSDTGTTRNAHPRQASAASSRDPQRL